MDSFAEALPQSLRRLVHRPGLTAAVVLILGVGIGVSTAVFSVVGRVLVRPIPVTELDRLVVAWEIDPSREGSLVEVSFPYFQDWRVQSRRGARPLGREPARTGDRTVRMVGRAKPARSSASSISSAIMFIAGQPE